MGRVAAWLAENWPPDLPWPDGLPHPDRAAPAPPALPAWMALGPDGEIADAAALCAALGVDRQVYYDTVRSYGMGRARHGKWPATPSHAGYVMDALVRAGDRRFLHPAYRRYAALARQAGIERRAA